MRRPCGRYWAGMRLRWSGSLSLLMAPFPIPIGPCVMKALNILMFLAVILGSGACRASQPAGTVVQLQDDVQVSDIHGGTRALRVGDPVEEGDELATASRGHVQLRMSDDAYLAMRPNTRLRIEIYQAPDTGDGNCVMYLLKGSLRAVSGWIGKSTPARYLLRTPVASLAVRGTDYEVAFITDAEATAEIPPGAYDRVYEGETVLETAGGKVAVSPGQAGFAPPHLPPRLLANLPSFLKSPPSLDEKLEAIKPLLRARIEEHLEQIRQWKQEISTHALQLHQPPSLPVFPAWSSLGISGEQAAP